MKSNISLLEVLGTRYMDNNKIKNKQSEKK